MKHITLSTGHVHEFSLIPSTDSVVQTLMPLVITHGGPLPEPISAFGVDIRLTHGGSVFTVLRGHQPIVTCGVAINPEAAAVVWPALEKLHFSTAKLPGMSGLNAYTEQPIELPWLAAVILPATICQPRDDFSWLTGFEQNMASALIQVWRKI